jgi:hypothetical protein
MMSNLSSRACIYRLLLGQLSQLFGSDGFVHLQHCEVGQKSRASLRAVRDIQGVRLRRHWRA